VITVVAIWAKPYLCADAEEGAELSVTAVLIWEQCLKKLRDILTQMGQEHRGMHGGVSKCGKEIDRVRFLLP
jgi:hypothetical protein